MARSYQEQLDAVDAACAAIESGAQEYYIEDRRVRRGELSQLYKERDRLTALVARQSNPIFSVVQRDQP